MPNINPHSGIREIAYNLYIQDWLDSNVTAEEKLSTLRRYFEYTQECMTNDDEPDSFNEWIWENGYESGTLYVCFDEFCAAEYLNQSYMRYLLHDETLFAKYCEDVQSCIKKRYYVTYRFEARYMVGVDAKSIEEALQLAKDEYMDADFGLAVEIDGEPIIMEDEYGNYVWEKD